MKKLRCAIYTRKSTDEGLDQSFNSLDAQREACAAYVLSQAGEGWTALKDIYDDGGFSGGSIERPALKRLLANIAAGQVDVVVVYKVDRLTRSLADFARIVEILDQADASFVSVTQAFNTTTSMGRLTLNVLLSFAQFEREVTGERIRDKIAASKAKGMWMGGHPPLGYDIRDRALHINEAEAETVRSIFRLYLEERNVNALRDRLERESVRSKTWTSRAGVEHGGSLLGKGALYHILSSRLYLGEIVHRDKAYPGQHEAIVSAELFEAVQQKLKLGSPAMPSVRPRGYTPLLLGKLFDDRGSAMTSAHANKKGVRYFYYVSVAHTIRKNAGTLPRVSAPALDRTILELLATLLDADWTLGERDRMLAAVERIDLSAERVCITLLKEALRSDLQSDAEVDAHTIRIERTHDLKSKRGRRCILAARAEAARVDRALVRAIVQARRWNGLLASGEVASIRDLAARENVCPIYTGQLLPLAFLAPDLVEAILDGRQPAHLSLNRLLATDLPLAWRDQRALFSRLE